MPNLDRLKQAFEDAFRGTGQPTFAQGLKVALDEVGWQVDTASSGAYAGAENVPTIAEETQAEYYRQLVEYLACDPSVESLHFFHLVDEADRDRFQSGLLRADRSRRASYEAVKAAVAALAAGCPGTPAVWRPTTTVLGGGASFTVPKRNSARRRFWSFHVTATEDASYTAQLVQARGRRAVLRTKGRITANFRPLVRFPKRTLKPGAYVFRVVIRSASAPSRAATFTSKPFRVG